MATGGSCPLCGGAGTHAFYASDRNREITEEHFSYARCETCATIFMVDVPADLGRYYEGDYYQFGPGGEPAWKTSKLRVRAEAYRVELLRRQIATGRLIEIGSGTGGFAMTAKAAGFDVTSIEMSERCCRYLNEQAGIEAICSDRPLDALASLPAVDVVALWHVLEHLPNPGEMLELIAEKLTPGGVLALAVPNPRSLQFRLMGSRWAHLDAPRHLCLIPPAALVKKGDEAGMRCVAMTTNDPDGLDCNFFGWVNAFERRPASGSISRLGSLAALGMNRVLAPVERTGHRGAAITVLLRKEERADALT
jgi:SAM-dependent methyltransferase